MWKMILGQSVYKLAIIFTLYFTGDNLLDAHLDSVDMGHRSKQLSTVVFNTFVWMQIFNELNNRRLDNKFNVFEGVLRNYWFLGINAVMIGGQIMIIFIGGAAFSVTRLSGILWAICIICSLGCLPWAIVLRMIPDRQFGIVFNTVVDAMALILRPIAKCFKIFRRELKKLCRPVMRFTHRKPSCDAKKAKVAERSLRLSDIPSINEIHVMDEGSPTPARQESPEHSWTASAISVPPITVTAYP